MPEDAPKNLPTEGKNLLEDVKGGAPATPPGPPKSEAPPPVPSQPVSAKKEGKAKEGIEAQDIFADVSDTKGASVSSGPAPALPKGDTAPQGASVEDEETEVETPQKGFKKILMTIGIIIVVVAVLGGVGYWAYTQFLQPKEFSPNLNLNVSLPPPAQVQPQQPAPTPVPVSVDSDNDGLTDSEEATLGTNPNNPDSDGDRLFDREEVQVYKPDPLVKDTDGDGFLDGAEVQAGYDPKGPGKLIKIPPEGSNN